MTRLVDTRRGSGAPGDAAEPRASTPPVDGTRTRVVIGVLIEAAIALNGGHRRHALAALADAGRDVRTLHRELLAEMLADLDQPNSAAPSVSEAR